MRPMRPPVSPACQTLMLPRAPLLPCGRRYGGDVAFTAALSVPGRGLISRFIHRPLLERQLPAVGQRRSRRACSRAEPTFFMTSSASMTGDADRDKEAAAAGATDWTALKKAADLPFASTNRGFRAAGDDAYIVDSASVRLSDIDGLPALLATAATTVPAQNRPPLALTIVPLAKGGLRLLIDEFVPVGAPRHKLSGVLSPSWTRLVASHADLSLSVSSTSATLGLPPSAAADLRLTFMPLSISLVSRDEQRTTLATLNACGRLHLDRKTDVARPEFFAGRTDPVPFGPQSVAADICFPHALALHGLASRSAALALPDTTAPDGTPLTEPFRLYNLDVAYFKLNSPFGLYGNIPLLFARSPAATVGVFWHNASETYVDVSTAAEGDARHSHFYSEAAAFDVFLLPGATPAAVFDKYLALTGAPAMQQRFALGYHQCRYSYMSDADVREVYAGFEKHDIPYDVLWLDIDYTRGKRYFTWDYSRFPDPSAIQTLFRDSGRKMVCIIDPHIKVDDDYHVHKRATRERLYVTNTDGSDFVGDCWPGRSSYLDFTSSKTFAMWAEQFSAEKFPTFSDTIHIWNDMNEPSVFNGPERSMPKESWHAGDVEHRNIHNIYGHSMISSTHAGIKGGHGGEKRPFVLTRSFFAGSQRFAAVWTGDNTADWGHLRASVPMLLSLGLCGITFCGADVGGFFQNPGAELLARWYQAAAFQPFFRGHSSMSTKRREPWTFGEPTTGVIREAIVTRYEYIPFWYTLFAAASLRSRGGFRDEEIAPAMRPLWWEFDGVAESSCERQWMVGNALLVAPVLDEGVKEHAVLAPAGAVWYDVMHPDRAGTRVAMTAAEDVAVIDVNVARQVVFQRGGTVVPTAQRGSTRSTRNGYMADGICLSVALDAHGMADGVLYVDDNESFAFKDGDFVTCRVGVRDGVVTETRVAGELSRLSAENGGVVGRITVLGVCDVVDVIVDGERSVPFKYDMGRNVLVVDGLNFSVGSGWQLRFVQNS